MKLFGAGTRRYQRSEGLPRRTASRPTLPGGSPPRAPKPEALSPVARLLKCIALDK